MRKLLAIALSLGIFLAGATASADVFRRDPGDAFPWGAEIPFPWKGMQGTWVTTIDGETNYFSFKIVKSSDGVSQMKIRQYRSYGCEFVGEGAGYEQNRVVEAIMISAKTAYSLKVHVFKESDIKTTGYEGNLIIRGVRTVTVMRMVPLSGYDVPSDVETYQLLKVDSDPKAVCPLF